MITIVSGIPRSGTSLMMQMLERSGMEILTDGIRKADDNNLKGYYEYEKVKTLMKDNSWLGEAEGKVVKVISGLLAFLPDNHEYKIIFMQRDIDEILCSQAKMLERLGIPQKADPKSLKMTFEKQLVMAKKMLSQQTKMEFIEISYRKLVLDPENEIKKINEFFGNGLDEEKMKMAVDKSLYREKNIIMKGTV